MKLFSILSLAILLSISNPSKKQKEALMQTYDSCRTCITHYNKLPSDDAQCAYKEIEIGNRLNDNGMILQGYIDLARSMSALGKYDMALEHAHKALEISGKQNSDGQTAELYRLLGSIYTSLNNTLNATSYLEKAREYYASQKDTFNLIKTMGTIAINHAQKKDYATSVRIFQEIYDMSVSQGNLTLQLVTLLNLAKLHNLSGNPDKGLSTLRHIEAEIPDSIINRNYRTEFLLKKGELLLEKGRHAEAKACFVQGMQNGDTAGMSIDNRISFLKGISQIAMENGDFQTAAQHYSDILAIEDSLKSNDMQQKARDMEFIYNMKMHEQKMAELRGKSLRNQILLACAVCLFVAVAVLVYRRSKKKMSAAKADMDTLNRKLVQKRKEITNLAIYYHEMRNVASAAVADIRKLEADSDNPQRKELKRIARQLDEGFTNDIQTPIYAYIDENYSEFIQKISQKYPDLVVSEKRICAMLLIDFSTKDISNVLNLSERSINNIRSKIRKKMEIKDNISISDFLKKL